MTPGAPVAVIGAGPMGLAAAYELAKRGARVTVFERDDRIGGMSASLDFDGTRIERYYHFICRTDHATFDYLREFGLTDRLRWKRTRMGFYFNGTLHDWGSPLALLRFPNLSAVQKLRYALHVLRAKSISDWRPYDRITSVDWLTRWIGAAGYELLWHKLFHYKFYEFENRISAAWLGTRIRRVALSRENAFHERLGYLEGGSEVLLQAVARRIVELGGTIALSSKVEEVLVEGSGDTARVVALRSDGRAQPFDCVISTIPLPYLVKLIPALPPAEKQKIAAICNVGVVCVLLKLKAPFTANFWTNINDPRIELPGLIEYSNLCDRGVTLLYAPYYMPASHPKYRRDARAFIEETIGYLKLIRSDFNPADVIAATASRYEFAQTVCPPGFYDALPPMKSALGGLLLADTSHYYPEDRSISESLRVGARLAALATGAD